MSTNQEDLSQDTGDIQPITATGTSPISMDYQWRNIAGLSPSITSDDLLSLGVIQSSPSGDKKVMYNPSVYWIAPPAIRGTLTPKIQYKGSGLVDEFNRLTRSQYNVMDSAGTDVRNELMLLNRQSGQALALFKELKRVGFYGNQEISNMALNNQGYGPTDEAAMTRFLDYANQNFRTWEATLPLLFGMTSVASSGSSYRGPSTEEVVAYLDEAALQLTGRKLSKSVLKRAVERVIAEDRAIVSGGKQQAPTGLLAETEVKKVDPARAAAYGLGNAIQMALEYLGK